MRGPMKPELFALQPVPGRISSPVALLIRRREPAPFRRGGGSARSHGAVSAPGALYGAHYRSPDDAHVRKSAWNAQRVAPPGSGMQVLQTFPATRPPASTDRGAQRQRKQPELRSPRCDDLRRPLKLCQARIDTYWRRFGSVGRASLHRRPSAASVDEKRATEPA